MVALQKIAFYLGLFVALLTLLHFLGIVNPVGATVMSLIR
jgi:hypothetical protein